MKILKGQLKISQLSIKSKKVTGATLLELILSIGIIAMVAGFILLNGNLVEKYKEKIELKSLIVNINLTRNYAISNREEKNINFNFSTNEYQYETGNLVVEHLTILKLVEKESNTESFAFTKNGAPSYNGSGTICLLGSENYYYISVTPAIGKVNLKEVKK